MDDLIESLGKTSLFENLSTASIGKLLEIAEIRNFARGSTIMVEGQTGSTLFIMLDGTVEVSKNLIMNGVMLETENASKFFTRLDANSHAVFGEIGLLEDSKRTATVRAVTDCRVCEIKKDDFFKLAESEFEIGYRVLLNMSKIVSSRLRKADEEIIKLTTVLTVILKE